MGVAVPVAPTASLAIGMTPPRLLGRNHRPELAAQSRRDCRRVRHRFLGGCSESLLGDWLGVLQAEVRAADVIGAGLVAGIDERPDQVDVVDGHLDGVADGVTDNRCGLGIVVPGRDGIVNRFYGAVIAEDRFQGIDHGRRRRCVLLGGGLRSRRLGDHADVERCLIRIDVDRGAPARLDRRWRLRRERSHGRILPSELSVVS